MANLEVLFQRFRSGYENNWQSMQIRPSCAGQASQQAARLLNNKSIYQNIETITHVPWHFIGLCHYRESRCDLNTYLGNGQLLNKVTTIVPKGRGPFTGPNAFVDGAVDALRIQGLVGSTDWSLARTLFRLEGFNGYGYHSRGVNSPYLWSGSTVYGPPEEKAGKFVADGAFDPDEVDSQLGVAVILKQLMELDQSIVFAAAPLSSSGSPEPDVTLSEDVLLVQQSLNKLGIVPTLVEDGMLGPRTKAAISLLQSQSGLPDTGLPDAVTIAEIGRRSGHPAVAMPPVAQPAVPMPTPDVLARILQGMQTLEQAVLSMKNSTAMPPATTNPNDPVNIIETVLGITQKLNLQPDTGTAIPVVANAPSADRLKQVLAVITAAFGQSKPPLGQVNGALGETIGYMLNGKKTAIGIGGSLITSLLAAVTSSPNAGGLAGLLGTIVMSVPGLSQFTLPIFLAMTAWGVLGKLENWSQGTVVAPRRQV